MQSVVEVKDVGKVFQIGSTQSYYALRDQIADMFKFKKDGNTKTPFWALRDVSFDVQPGEAIGIIGRNGAGKSTLLKILSQITPPTTGRITMRGRVASLLEVGTGFHPELTGRENIYLNGAILGMMHQEIKKKFDEIVAFAEIERFLDTPVKRYSSGMYIRLAFAVAAHLEPEILIVDEVLAVGDVEFQKKCLGKMEQVTAQEGRTILFVSHNLLTVQNLCEKTILLENGLIKKMGETNAVIDTYVHSKSNQKEAPANSLQLHYKEHLDDIRFTEIKISNTEGSGAIKSDDKLRIVLKYSSDFKEPLTDARVIITVLAEPAEHIVLRLDSDVTADTIDSSLKPNGEIVCETGAINLNGGMYMVNLDLTTQGNTRVHLERIMSFNVETDIEDYHYQTHPDKNACDYLIKYNFKQP